MSYHVQFSDPALKILSKLDRPVQSLILKWVRKNLEGCEDPRIHGKALVGNYHGMWRYRVADYRLVCTINDGIVLITVVTIGHRRDIYKK